MTKFIEGAREIEMDAVAKNGKVRDRTFIYCPVHTRQMNLKTEVSL